MKPPINDIDRQAAEWAVAADDENFSTERQAALDAWLESDPRHFGAYINARAALARIERLGAAAQSVNYADNKQGPSVATAGYSKRRFMLTGSIAAGLAALVITGSVWWSNSYNAILVTPVGQTKVAVLPDHSTITLNTDTRAEVRYSAVGRDIALKRGEALFDVAKNRLRPFVVRVQGVKVRAVGTSFSIGASDDHPLQVMVREGVVEINAPNAADLRVYAGSRAVLQADGKFVVEALTARQISEGLVWRSGHIFFRHQTLAASAAEFKRYSNTRIVVDPAIANNTVTGMFVASDPAGFADAVGASLDLNVDKRGDKIYIAPK